MKYPTLEEARNAVLVEGEHLWIRWAPTGGEEMICCRWCMIVRRRDGKNKPCRGKVTISLRG